MVQMTYNEQVLMLSFGFLTYNEDYHWTTPFISLALDLLNKCRAYAWWYPRRCSESINRYITVEVTPK